MSCSLLWIPTHDKLKSQIGATFGGREVPLLEPGVDEQVKSLIDNIRRNLVNATSNDSSGLLDLAPLDLYNFLREVREILPKNAMIIDIPLMRNIILSPLFLKLFGPSVTDIKGMGKLMGVARDHASKRYLPDAKPQRDLLALRSGLG
ncbi:hypothetical protein F4803DRAFT_557558 [Xylaria telfairii]|nr:hypothetical protein F4803DRAFT_557558 [Xylaria telfairii]